MILTKKKVRLFVTQTFHCSRKYSSLTIQKPCSIQIHSTLNFLKRYPYLTYLRAEHHFRTSSDIKLLGALVVLPSFEASRPAMLCWFAYFILLVRLGFSFTFNDQRDIYELSFISSIAILLWIITAKFPVFYLKTEIRVKSLCLNLSLFETNCRR